MSQECTRRIVSVEGTLRAICNRLLVIETDNKTSKDLAEQCIKTLELICARESSAVFEAGGLQCILPFIVEHGHVIYKDSLHSAMAVVTRLCAKMEPSDESLDQVVATLSKLIKHEDAFVADGALRCFASLSDRFSRKGVDPAPLAKYGLVDELIRKLGDSVQVNSVNKWSQSAGLNTAPAAATPTTETANKSTAAAPAVTVSISTLTGLLSTLCRSSDSINKQLLESNILDSIEKALYGDERCVLDTMRFLDLLVTLIFEGRQALRKQMFTPSAAAMITRNDKNTLISTGSSSSSSKLKKYDPNIDKIHRQLIEYIRLKDTHSFVTTLETHSIDLNFMDDVGQTLLNWTSAFGTLEMVEYLASRGADVNKGVRSSSLHYAACFGRANLVRLLLSYGANPELRDEEGKTALDKARERGEESHREVVQILQHAPAVGGGAGGAGEVGSGVGGPISVDDMMMDGGGGDGMEFDGDGLDDDEEDDEAGGNGDENVDEDDVNANINHDGDEDDDDGHTANNDDVETESEQANDSIAESVNAAGNETETTSQENSNTVKVNHLSILF